MDKTYRSLLVIVFVIIGAFGFAVYFSNGPSYRDDLPPDAIIVNEERSEDGFLPDYSYGLCAKMDEADFDSYAKQFEWLKVRDNPKMDEGLWKRLKQWKDFPGDAIKRVYFFETFHDIDEERMLAAYDYMWYYNGHMYVVSGET